MVVSRIIDLALEGPIVPSFTRIGFDVRSRVERWTRLDDYDLSGRTVVLTGGTSGLGRSAALLLARAGADVTVTSRSGARAAEAAQELTAEIATEQSPGVVRGAAADMGDFAEVRALAEQLLEDHERIDVLVHNAGALSAERHVNPTGAEATVASQVYGPFLLTSLLLDRLSESGPSRVLTMSSGGMYAAGLTVAGLEMSTDDYDGTMQYAIAKRAQVTLNEMWADRFGDRGVRFHAAHPGWADTPGVEDALPTFGKVLGPLLRPAEQGADTIAWLAADDGEPLTTNGAFWHDRRVRSIHKTPISMRADTPERRSRLWERVCDEAGVRPG